MKDLSAPLLRRDGAAKISGRARYVGDYQLEGVLHAKTVRATIAKGEILEIRLKLPEVALNLAFGFQDDDFGQDELHVAPQRML